MEEQPPASFSQVKSQIRKILVKKEQFSYYNSLDGVPNLLSKKDQPLKIEELKSPTDINQNGLLN